MPEKTKTRDILDLGQITGRKRDLSRTILMVGAVVMAIFFFIGFLDAIGGLKTGFEWIDYLAFGLGTVRILHHLQAQADQGHRV